MKHRTLTVSGARFSGPFVHLARHPPAGGRGVDRTRARRTWYGLASRCITVLPPFRICIIDWMMTSRGFPELAVLTDQITHTPSRWKISKKSPARRGSSQEPNISRTVKAIVIPGLEGGARDGPKPSRYRANCSSPDPSDAGAVPHRLLRRRAADGHHLLRDRRDDVGGFLGLAAGRRPDRGRACGACRPDRLPRQPPDPQRRRRRGRICSATLWCWCCRSSTP